MSDLKDLYQEVIFDHNRNPRHFGKVENANRCAKGFNPLCGDKMTLYLKIDAAGRIADVSFEGSGCAISVASASLMTDVLVGKTVQEAEALFEKFHGMMMSEKDSGEQLGKLQVLSGVKGFPSRIKCATLAWHALHAALKEQGETVVSTE
jgi:nitrogen fixation protein NifU and related proteins